MLKLVDCQHSEIQQYINGRLDLKYCCVCFDVLILRYLSASEAIWKILQFKITERSHAVLKLACHQENEQFIIFAEDQPETGLARGELDTTLTAWFKANGPASQLSEEDRELARGLTYNNFPSQFVYLNRRWHRRKQGFGKTIGRIPIVPFNVHTMERYSMRLLLHHQPGATSFNDLKMVNGDAHASFQAAAIALGLLEDDAELDKVPSAGLLSISYCSSGHE